MKFARGIGHKSGGAFIASKKEMFSWIILIAYTFTYNRSDNIWIDRKEYSTSNQSNHTVVINEFWDHLYREIKDQSRDKDTAKYNEKVITLLNEYKRGKEVINNTMNISDYELHNLQNKIEDITSQFDECSIFNETPNLIKLLIGKNLISAKNYLYKFLPKHLYNSTIYQFGQYTLEAIIIYVLGLLYNCIQDSSVVRVSTLLDKLDSTVRTQANIINKKNKVSMVSSTASSTATSSRIDIKSHKYKIGKELLEFMIERNLIHIEKLSADSNKTVVKEKGKGYIEYNLFAICNFDLSLIPLKLSLPMVCKPLNWEHISDKSKPFLLSDMVGGYLSCPTLDMYNGLSLKSSLKERFSLISSNNLNNFNIELDDARYKEMCNILNGLQKQGFQINSYMLEFIKNHRATLEKVGLLMPEILKHVNLKDAYDLMRKLYFQNKDIKNVCRLSDLLKEFASRVQTARYEDFIIRLASAYEGYVFYLPAFMDFRGRIYRSGILHFHERDFARGLIVFANNQQEGINQSAKDIIATSAALKYKKFNLYDDALKWYKENQSLIYASDESLISFVKGASEPFQFIAKVLCYDRVQEYNRIPITQDAAASAYQIMSYLLLNEEMAMRTNVIPCPDGKIQDVYTHLLHDLKDFLHHRINDKLQMEIIESKLDRKLIKSLFMPLIYGKTLMSMEKDIRLKYGELLSRKDSYNLAKLSNEFWIHKYPDIVYFMKLITIVSWFSSVMDRAVVYSVPYFTTKQDYMSFVKEEILVYEKTTKKKRRVTLRIPTMKRDKRKTQSSACANFIHQKDAYIAMMVVKSLLSERAPIYTVHDNFITTLPYVGIVPDIYTNIFIKMGHPIKIINSFIIQNLSDPSSSFRSKYYPMLEYPIPSDDLTDLMNSLLPKSISKKKWDKKVSEFVTYYNNYVDAVCCNQKKDNWNQFKKLIENRSHNYSLHY